MFSCSAEANMDTDQARWDDARRIEAWAGEVRVNLIRLAAIVVFYGHHLVNVYLFRDDPDTVGRFHVAVTALVMAWAAEVLLLYICLARRWMPPALPWAVVGCDIVLITLLVILTQDARTLLVVLYLLVVFSTALRLSLSLIYGATFGSMAAFLFFLGFVKYGLELPNEQRLTRPNEVIFVLALGAAGLLAGQMVRQARRLAQGYPVVVADEAVQVEAGQEGRP
jgi:hypothetical protein